MAKLININYPFKNSQQGYYLDMNETNSAAIKSDLMHLLLTRKGERLYMPEFGTDLLKFIFDPYDKKTITDLKMEISETVKKFIPNLTINNIIVEESDLSEYAATVKIDYTITNGVFVENEIITINI
jgi:phage baseplate assembly protein W